MSRRQKLTQGQFKEIKDHWDICTNDGCGVFYPKDIKSLESILNHCNFCHHIQEILPSQKDKLLKRLIERDNQIKAKRH